MPYFFSVDKSCGSPVMPYFFSRAQLSLIFPENQGRKPLSLSAQRAAIAMVKAVRWPVGCPYCAAMAMITSFFFFS
jgi:hypothetical protein